MYKTYCVLLITLAYVSMSVPHPFPESRKRIDVNRHGKEDERIPLHIPGKCPQNQILYPGDKYTEWTCDCAPGYIYYPLTKTCYAAYERGPCPQGFILVNPIHEIEPECLANWCKDKEGTVSYRGQCWKLGKPGGPCHNIEDGVLGVDPKTLRLGCLKNDNPGLALLSSIPTRACNPGSIRIFNGKCKPEFYF